MGLFSIFKKTKDTPAADVSNSEASATPESKDLLKANTLKYDALRALKIGEIDFALRALRSSLSFVDDIECRLYLAQALQRVPDWTAAETELQHILSEYPAYPQALYEATKVAAAQDHHDETLAYAERALATELEAPVYAELHRIAAQAYLALARLDEAMTSIDRALALTDKISQYWLIKLKILLAQEQWQEALNLTSEIAKAFPEEERTHLYRGIILYHDGRKEEAEAAYRDVIALDPFNAEGYERLIHLAEELHGAEAAGQLMEEALEQIPSPTRALLVHGEYLFAQLQQEEQHRQVVELLASLPEEEGDKTANFSNLYAGGLY